MSMGLYGYMSELSFLVLGRAGNALYAVQRVSSLADTASGV
jgi:hypothetical protein